MKQTAVEWLIDMLVTENEITLKGENYKLFDQAKAMEKEQALDFGEFIIDELEPMAQNRDWIEERYSYFKSE